MVRRRHLIAGLAAVTSTLLANTQSAAFAFGSRMRAGKARPVMASEASKGQVEYLNPEGLPQNPAFTNVVTVSGPVRTIYIGGQDAVDGNGRIVGVGDIAAQTGQVLANILTALEAAGAGPEHVVKWNVLVVQGQSLQEGFAAFQRVWGQRNNPPVITMAFVSALANPEFLVEMDAIAVVPL
ncbi:MAG TPA: RidA family protein [Thermomicrobiales bacterium]|nr:RidA family protein [Thermomicrobiales bacterium]